tara:strand:+ start:33679 stop:34899 length:1221 start_codon:yes stop_codon:yes gene_type:complete
MLYDIFVDYYDFNSLFILIFSELTNFFFCSFVLLLLYYFKKLDFTELIVWLFGFASVFFVSAFVINQGTFPDIDGYMVCLRDLRDNWSFQEKDCGFTQIELKELFNFFNLKRPFTALLYGIVPIPSTASIVSLGVINKLYLLGLYLFIKPRLINDQAKWLLLIFFFLPTILIYSSTGLRDNLILITQILLLFTIIERRLIISTVLLTILFAIKTQNALILSILYLGVFIFRSHARFLNLGIFAFLILIFILIFNEFILDVLNYFRLAFLNEVGLLHSEQEFVGYTSLFRVILASPIIFINALIEPGLSSDPFSMIFFLESLLIIYLFLKFIFSSRFFSSSLNVLVFLVFFTGIVLNQLVVESDYTLLRYRYTYIHLFLFYLLLIYDQSERKISFPFLPKPNKELSS